MQLEMFNEQLKIKCGLACKAPEGGRQKGLYTSCRSPTRESQGRLERILKRHRWCWLGEKTAATTQILLRPYPLCPRSNNSLSLQWGRATKTVAQGYWWKLLQVGREARKKRFTPVGAADQPQSPGSQNLPQSLSSTPSPW